MLGLLRMIKLLQGRKHPETEVMERSEDELERIMIGIPGGFFEDIVHKYSNELRRRIMKNSGCKLPFLSRFQAWRDTGSFRGYSGGWY